MAGFAFEIFDFLDALMRHDFVRKYVDPGTDQDKRLRRPLEGCRDESGGAGTGSHLHFAREHRLNGGGGIGLHDFHVQPVLFVRALVDGNAEKSGAGIYAGLANGHLASLRINSRRAKKSGRREE